MGLVSKVTDPMGFTTNYVYDKIGNVTSESFSGGSINTTKTYAYDYTGNTLTYTNEKRKEDKVQLRSGRESDFGCRYGKQQQYS